MKRRTFIRLAGGGLVLGAASAGLYGYAARNVFPVPDTATAAWREAGEGGDPRYYVLSYAILAPNPHNMQPWMAALESDNAISVFLDESRLLPETDPYGRQILMGLGAFLELLAMSAATIGYRADVTLFPDGVPETYLDTRRVAHIVLEKEPAAVTDPLFAGVLERRTDRRAYDGERPVTEAEIAALAAAAQKYDVSFGVEATEKRDAIRKIAREAWYQEITTEGPLMESYRVLRVGTAEINTYRDGIVLTDPLVVSMAKLGLFDRGRMPSADSAEIKAQLADFDAITASTPAYLWIVTRGNARFRQVEAGAAYLRVNLAATARGLSMHPNEQSLQEYPGVARQYTAIHDLLDAPSPQYTVQMLARLGHRRDGDAPAPPAPRRGVSAQLMQS